MFGVGSFLKYCNDSSLSSPAKAVSLNQCYELEQMVEISKKSERSDCTKKYRNEKYCLFRRNKIWHKERLKNSVSATKLMTAVPSKVSLTRTYPLYARDSTKRKVMSGENGEIYLKKLLQLQFFLTPAIF